MNGKTNVVGKNKIILKIKYAASEVEFIILKLAGKDEIILGYEACRDLNIAFEPEVSINEYNLTMISPRAIKIYKTEIEKGDDAVVSKKETFENLNNRIVQILNETNATQKKIGLLKSDEQHRIFLIYKEKTICSNPYRKNHEQRRLVNEEVDKLLKEDKIKESDSPYVHLSYL